MVQTDPIADMLTVMRNGLLMKKKRVTSPYSRMKKEVLSVMKEEGFIGDFKETGEEVSEKTLVIYLKYGPKGEKVLNYIQKVSKPGRRMFAKIGNLRKVRNGLGVSILTTHKGVMSDRRARKEKVGGEVLCKLW